MFISHNLGNFVCYFWRRRSGLKDVSGKPNHIQSCETSLESLKLKPHSSFFSGVFHLLVILFLKTQHGLTILLASSICNNRF
jgi:hypothetical protein